MGKILQTPLQKALFITAAIITMLASLLAGANTSMENDWVNKDYDDYVKDKSYYSVTEAEIKEFRTLNGVNYKPLTILDFYRVCVVDVTFAGGQKMKFYIPRSSDDKIGDKVSVAYSKKWDTEYDRIMRGSDVDEDSILDAARVTKVTDGMYSRLFILIAIVSGIFTAAVFFICYKKKDAYNL